jgi:hypothetical protein
MEDGGASFGDRVTSTTRQASLLTSTLLVLGGPSLAVEGVEG